MMSNLMLVKSCRLLFLVALLTSVFPRLSSAGTLLTDASKYTSAVASSTFQNDSGYSISNVFDSDLDTHWASWGNTVNGNNPQGNQEAWFSFALNQSYLIDSINFAPRTPNSVTADYVTGLKIWIGQTTFGVNVQNSSATSSLLNSIAPTYNNQSVYFSNAASPQTFSLSTPVQGQYFVVQLTTTNFNPSQNIGASQFLVSVPEPSALSLLAVGLGGLAILRRRRPVRKVARSITLLSFVFFTNLCQAQLGFDNGTTWVDVADPGKGNVSYSFKISKYETTVTQYVSFLNSVAQTSDPHGLFHGFNWRYAEPINRSGSIGNYSYSVADGFQNRAITAMNWLDAARYVNWLHNGGTSSSDTETGVYSLNGVTSLTVGTTISRNTTAKFFIPTAEEWQKAGFYDPTKNGGSGGWWASANQSATTPGDPAVMNINQAYLDPIRGYVTDVGFFTEQDSFYGTYDQSGNVWEWTEGATLSGTVGGLNGGGWDYFDGTYGSVMVGGNKAADFRKDSTGFRIGAIPEPSALSLLAIGLGGLALMRRRRS